MRTLIFKLLGCGLLAAVLFAGVRWPPTGKPEIVYFGASARSIQAGESVTLSWETMGVNSVTLEWVPENGPRYHTQKRMGLPPMGALTVSPKESTVYVLSCEDSSAPMCVSASVTVKVTN